VFRRVIIVFALLSLYPAWGMKGFRSTKGSEKTKSGTSAKQSSSTRSESRISKSMEGKIAREVFQADSVKGLRDLLDSKTYGNYMRRVAATMLSEARLGAVDKAIISILVTLPVVRKFEFKEGGRVETEGKIVHDLFEQYAQRPEYFQGGRKFQQFIENLQMELSLLNKDQLASTQGEQLFMTAFKTAVKKTDGISLAKLREMCKS